MQKEVNNVSQSNNIAIGKWGEAIACEFFRKQRYAILGTNVRVKRKEIDLIVSKNGTVVFVEVKTACLPQDFHPAELVNKSKQRHLVVAAQLWLQQFPHKFDQFRFDVFTVIKKDTGNEIEHFPNAFYASEFKHGRS